MCGGFICGVICIVNFLMKFKLRVCEEVFGSKRSVVMVYRYVGEIS